MSMHEFEDVVEASVRLLAKNPSVRRLAAVELPDEVAKRPNVSHLLLARHPEVAGAFERDGVVARATEKDVDVRSMLFTLYGYQQLWDTGFTHFRLMDLLLEHRFAYRFSMGDHPLYERHKAALDAFVVAADFSELPLDPSRPWDEAMNPTAGYFEPPHLYCDAGSLLWDAFVQSGRLQGRDAVRPLLVDMPSLVLEIVRTAEAEGDTDLIAQWYPLMAATMCNLSGCLLLPIPALPAASLIADPTLQAIREIAIRTRAFETDHDYGMTRLPKEWSPESVVGFDFLGREESLEFLRHWFQPVLRPNRTARLVADGKLDEALARNEADDLVAVLRALDDTSELDEKPTKKSPWPERLRALNPNKRLEIGSRLATRARELGADVDAFEVRLLERAGDMKKALSLAERAARDVRGLAELIRLHAVNGETDLLRFVEAREDKNAIGCALCDAAEDIEGEPAFRLYELCTKLEHDYREIAFDRLARLAEEDAPDKLAAICAEGLRLFPSDYVLLDLLVDAHPGDMQRVLGLLPENIERHVGASAHFLQKLTYVFNEAGAHQRSIAAFEAYRQAGGDNLYAVIVNVANAYSGAGELDEAERLLQRAAVELAAAPIVDHALACVYARRGEPARALSCVLAARDKHYENFASIRDDVDLRSMASNARFVELVGSEPDGEPRGFARVELVEQCIRTIAEGPFANRAHPAHALDKALPATLRRFLEFDASWSTLARKDARGELGPLPHAQGPILDPGGSLPTIAPKEALAHLAELAGAELDDDALEALEGGRIAWLPSSGPRPLALFIGEPDGDGEYPIIDVALDVELDPEAGELRASGCEIEVVYPSFDLYLADQLGMLETAPGDRQNLGAWFERRQRHVENNPSLEG
jgi:hypothetical protein